MGDPLHFLFFLMWGEKEGFESPFTDAGPVSEIESAYAQQMPYLCTVSPSPNPILFWQESPKEAQIRGLAHRPCSQCFSFSACQSTIRESSGSGVRPEIASSPGKAAELNLSASPRGPGQSPVWDPRRNPVCLFLK